MVPNHMRSPLAMAMPSKMTVLVAYRVVLRLHPKCVCVRCQHCHGPKQKMFGNLCAVKMKKHHWNGIVQCLAITQVCDNISISDNAHVFIYAPFCISLCVGLQPRMRAILLDWLIEVCEVYKLHRETYYLAVDYLDRFLSSNVQISKTRLQLIGITCLFIAAKVSVTVTIFER